MRQFLFCHIGWMSRYQGLKEQSDKIVGGGSWIEENRTGAEVCNFRECDDGYVYGHVETLLGEPEAKGYDRKIKIEEIGARPDAEYIDGVTVVWTAKHPEGGRLVVGWYRDARIWRVRQEFKKAPSRQHRKDGLDTYRVRAQIGNKVLLPPEARYLAALIHEHADL